MTSDLKLTPATQRRLARQRFVRARIAEVAYRRQLSQVARHVGSVVKGFAPGGRIERMPELQETLRAYATILRPWARSVIARMQAEVSQRDLKAWKELTTEMGRNLRNEIASAPTGIEMKTLMELDVELITSLPLEAARRVHRLTQEGIINSTRASEIQMEILRTGQVTLGRAKTIARTEVARTASTLTEARATYIGSEGYFWRTSGDSDVRPEHRKLNGKFFRWDDPPVSGSRGERAHAGQIYNCRCYPDPVIPEVV